MEKIISEILDLIYPDNDEKNQFSDEIFDKVEQFVKLCNNENIPEILYKFFPTEIKKLGILFDILIWSTPDNGARLSETTRKWFMENSEQKIEIVINMTNIYPYFPFENLRRRLEEIILIYPKLQPRCLYWLKSIEYN